MMMGEAAMTGAAGQKRVPTAFLEEFLLGVPSATEQSKIVSFLFESTKLTRKLKENLETEILKLKEYKSSLIFNAVTGKLPING